MNLLSHGAFTFRIFSRFIKFQYKYASTRKRKKKKFWYLYPRHLLGPVNKIHHFARWWRRSRSHLFPAFVCQREPTKRKGSCEKLRCPDPHSVAYIQRILCRFCSVARHYSSSLRKFNCEHQRARRDSGALSAPLSPSFLTSADFAAWRAFSKELFVIDKWKENNNKPSIVETFHVVTKVRWIYINKWLFSIDALKLCGSIRRKPRKKTMLKWKKRIIMRR